MDVFDLKQRYHGRLVFHGGLSVCGLKYADVRDEGHFGYAKRLECVQLAGAVVKRGRAESGSKLHALQTLRARERPSRTTIRRLTYVPEY